MPHQRASLPPADGNSFAATIPWWLYAIVIAGAFLLAGGAAIALLRPAMLVSPHDQVNAAARVYAGYFASRNLALAVMLLVLLGLRASRALSGLMVLIALIQVLDAGMDCVEARWTIVPGVLILGLIFAIGAWRLSGHPFWKSRPSTE